MKRALGFLLVLVGVIAVAAGSVVGGGVVFSWRGRHPVATYDLAIGAPLRAKFHAKRGVRYTAGIQVVFEREKLARQNGQLVVEAYMPLVAVLRDADGDAKAKTVGWLDPTEPPTVLYGVAEHRGVGPVPEVVAERIVGPFPSPRDETMSIEVDLGPNRGREAAGGSPPAGAVESAGSPIGKARVVLYDDAYPPSVPLAFGVAALGAVVGLAGVVVLMAGFFGKKRGIRQSLECRSSPPPS